MKRRTFLGTVAASGVAATLGDARSALGDNGPLAAGTPLADDRLPEATIAELQAEMSAGRLTSRRLVDYYIRRIASLDRAGPRLGHVLEINPEAVSIATALDAERRTRGPRGPLHGIPILVKDNIATADQMQTTAGSYALEGVRPPRDGTVAAKLRAAGAVILGKTNLSEWANYRSTRSVSGWSGRGGQTRNPHALDRNPSGSSSGSAVGAAAGTCAAAIGTETNGSIISPSSICGIVGLKPTVGLVSRAGIVPIAHSQDTAGPMTRTVADAAAVLGAVAGADAADEATAAAGDHAARDYTAFLDPDGLRGARIGVVRERYTGFSPKTDLLFEAALGVLRERGAEIVDPANVASLAQLTGQGDLLSYEFKTDIERYLAEWAPGAAVRTLDDLIAFNRREAARELPFFGQEIFEQAARRGPLTSPEYLQVKERLQRASRTEGIDAVMDQHRLDALVAPSTGPARPIDLVSGDSGGGGSSGLAAIAGCPHLTVPMGFIHSLPVGLSFFGRAWSESVLLRLAYAYEQATRHRRLPRFAPTADVPWDGRGRG
ncbi:MAG: amidase [Gemmatimonadota bacterium]